MAPRVRKNSPVGSAGSAPAKRRDTRRGRFYDQASGEAYPSVTTVLNVLNKPALIGWAAKEERKLLLEAVRLQYEEMVETVAEPIPASDFIELVVGRVGDARAHVRKLQEASNIGTQVHARIEWDIRTMLAAQKEETYIAVEPVLTHPKAENSWKRYLEWKAATRMRPLAAERQVVSHVHKYAGTEDASLMLWPEADDPIWEVVPKRPSGSVVVTGDFKTGKAVYGEAFLQNAAYRLAEREMGFAPDAGIIIRLPKEEEDPEFEVVAVPALEELIPAFLALLPVHRWWMKEEARRDRMREAAKAPRAA